MKKYLALLILTILFFATATFSTAKIETPFDGNDTYGFPMTFFVKCSSMCLPCPTNATETFYLNLLVDILFAIVLTVIVLTVFKRAKFFGS